MNTNVRNDIWLILDDDYDITTLIEEFLKDNHIDCLTCTDPRQVANLLEKYQICGVICDYIMPHLNGLQVHDIIRKTPSSATIPFILISGRLDVAYDSKIADDEYSYFLSKPVDFERLLKLVARQLKPQNLLLDPKDYQSYEVEGLFSKVSDPLQSIPVNLLDFTPETLHFEVKKDSLVLSSTYKIELHCAWDGDPLQLQFEGLIIKLTPLDSTCDEAWVTPLGLNPQDFKKMADVYRQKQLTINDFLERAKGLE